MSYQIGYIRVSTLDQNTSRQLDGIKLDREPYTDFCSGKDTKRPQLEAMLANVRSGDCIHVHSIDRLARSLVDLRNLITELNSKGVSVVFHKNNLTFSAGAANSPTSNLMLNMLGAVAEFEREMILERQREGIAKAKELGKYKGRPVDIDRRAVITDLHASGTSKAEIARQTNMSYRQVLRILKTTQG